MNDTISKTVFRRYILGKQGLWPGRRWAGKEGAAEALREVESVQIDPVSVLAQSHDIVLWGRVAQYQPDHLHRVMYAERRFFDYGDALFIYPMEELPYWRVFMERRKSEKRWSDFNQAHPGVVDEVRNALRTNGPLRKRDLDGNSVTHYRASKDTGVALDYLWLTGELMSHSRQGKERVYDFLENVAPAALHWTAAEQQALDTFTLKSVSQRGFASERDLGKTLRALHERPLDKDEVRSKLEEMLAANQLRGVSVEGLKEPFYFPASDEPILESLANGSLPPEWRPVSTTTSEEVTFLSPLEYVSARGRAKKIFDFDYVWEIYKPAVTRQYGPYTLPALYGDRLVARMDAKLERSSGTLIVNGFWPEDWFAPGEQFADALARGLVNFSNLLGAQRADGAALAPDFLRLRVEKTLLENGIEPV